MATHDLCGYQVEIDEKATRTWYADAGEWGCDCGHCRNFLELSRNRNLPKSVMAVLNALEIPPEKATYIGELYTDDRGIHYQFSYRIAGRIVCEFDSGHSQVENSGRCCHEPYPYGAPGFPEPHFDLEFVEILPWVVE